jgi:hypothetical protein
MSKEIITSTTPAVSTANSTEGVINTLREVARAYRKVKKAIRLIKKSRKKLRDDAITGEVADKVLEENKAIILAGLQQFYSGAVYLTSNASGDGQKDMEEHAEAVVDALVRQPEKVKKVKEPKAPKVKKVRAGIYLKPEIVSLGNGVDVQIGKDEPKKDSIPLVFIKGNKVVGVTAPKKPVTKVTRKK